MKFHESRVESGSPLHLFVERFGSELCWLAFLITGDWQLSVEAVADVLVEAVAGVPNLEREDNQFSPEWALRRARRLVSAASVAAIRRDLLEPARRAEPAVGTDPTELTVPLARMRTGGSPPTWAELERSLLAIDAFPRCAVILTVLEGLPIEDAVLLLNADEGLVRGARSLGLVELTRNIAFGRRPRGLLQEGDMSAEVNLTHRLACLEIRGGNRSESYSVELPGLSGWVSCRPLTPSDHGGDLHYLTVCGEGAVSRIVLADVAGHGDIVSSVADRLRLGLRKHVNTWDQSVLLQELNDSFLAGADGVQYATAFVLGHYVQSGEVLFTNAGHLPPLWYRVAERKWVIVAESTPYAKEIIDLPLGLIPGTPYTQTAIQLSPGDLLLLYTDGITESRDSTGEELGIERLLELAASIPVESPDQAGQSLLSCVEAFRGTVPAADDETILVLRRSSNSPSEQASAI